MKKVIEKIEILKKDNNTIIEYVKLFKQLPKVQELFQNLPEYELLSKEDKKNIDE